MHVRPGQYTNAMPRTKPFPPKLPEENPENQVARQDPRYRGPEEGKDAKRTNYIEACTAKMDWPCHNKFLMSGCQRKFSRENCKKESAHKVA